MLSSRNSRSPFTAIQWQELENQALIYKYMVSGVPIPPDLLTAVRRSIVDSSLSSRLYPYYHQTIGWGCFEQLGTGRKPDLEPGRCRRTDGKKWRCPKEAYSGSRYCERHIHRGKSKAKKQLLEAAAASNNNNTNSSSSSNTTGITPTLSSFTAAQNQQQSNNQSSNSTFPFLCPNNNSSSASSSAGTLLSSQFSPQNSSTHLLSLDSGLNNLTNKDFRYFSEMKESVGERSFFPQDSRTGTSTYFPAAAAANLNSSSSGGLSNLPFQGYRVDTTAAMSKFREQQEEQYRQDSQNQNYQQQQHHSYFLGIEAKSVRPIKVKQDFLQPTIPTTTDPNDNNATTDPNDNNSDQKQPLHHFFGEQWSRKNCDSSTAAADSWFDYENSSERSNHCSISTTTQLSMAIPMSSQDIPSPYSRFHSDS